MYNNLKLTHILLTSLVLERPAWPGAIVSFAQPQRTIPPTCNIHIILYYIISILCYCKLALSYH
jgi:hypothetical protein